MAARDGGDVYTPEVTLDGHEPRRDSLETPPKVRRSALDLALALYVTRHTPRVREEQ